MTIFYTLEKMGLNVIANMMPARQVSLKVKRLPTTFRQCFDEARHVFSVENYLRKLGDRQYDWKYHVLGQIASLGFYRVENWLFSTLFSENFASAFLRRSQKAISIRWERMCKNLLLDESRTYTFYISCFRTF